METSILHAILSDKSLLAMMMSPGMVVTLIFMFIIYRTAPALTKAFHETTRAVNES